MTASADFAALTIGSPVMAAHINAILDRAAMIARYAPPVMSADTIGVVGYQYTGTKNNLPAASGVGFVHCDAIGAACRMNISTANINYGGRNAATDDPLRSSAELSTRYRVASVKSPADVKTIDVAANLVPNADLPGGPNVVQVDYVIDSLPSSASTPIGVWIADSVVGSWDWELDHLSFNAWISQPTVEASNAPSD